MNGGNHLKDSMEKIWKNFGRDFAQQGFREKRKIKTANNRGKTIQAQIHSHRMRG